MKDQSTEVRVAEDSTALRVTLQDIDVVIVGEHYFTAAQGAYGTGFRGDILATGQLDPLDLLTICVLVLENGFTVTGESACADPKIFNAEIGKQMAREAALRKIWPLLGYQLRERIFQSTKPGE